MVFLLLSLFYTPLDLQQVNKSEGTGAHSMCVQGISYTGTDNWRVWLNGQSISHDKAHAYGVLSVSPVHVCFKDQKCYRVGACYTPAP